jgi:hypothetical protein
MDTVNLMTKVDNELWDVVEKNVSEQDDMSKIAAVMLKVAVQMYKMTHTKKAVKGVMKYAIDNLDDVRVPGPPSETLH